MAEKEENIFSLHKIKMSIFVHFWFWDRKSVCRMQHVKLVPERARAGPIHGARAVHIRVAHVTFRLAGHELF